MRRNDTGDRIVDFIARFSEERGYQPSYREIAEGCDLGSIGTVKYQTDLLREEGRVDFVDREARTIHVTNDTDQSTHCP